MENTITFIIGSLLIILAFLWYGYERKKIIAEKKKDDYINMSFTIEFIFGAIILFAIGAKLIYDSF